MLDWISSRVVLDEMGEGSVFLYNTSVRDLYTFEHEGGVAFLDTS